MSFPKGRQVETWPLTPPFRQVGQSGWVCDLPAELQTLTDSNEQPYRCALWLYEGGQLLGPAHALHHEIEVLGGGCYSFWDRVVYFSTSDGTDPNQNGRAYLAALPVSGRVKAPDLCWAAPSRLLRCAVVGLGNRGGALAELAQSLPGVEIAWVVDQSMERLDEAPAVFGVGVKRTTDIAEALADSRIDVVFVTLPDHLHRQVAEVAFDAGKHVFLEKPVATTASDARAILAAWQRSGSVLQLGYVLRQTPFYSAIRKVIRDGMLGPVRIATLSEQLDVRHGGSFMRRWHSVAGRSGGLMVHKGCHDLDIVCWLLDAWPRQVSSFGRQGTFAEPAPAEFCSACPRQPTCPYADGALHERRSAAEIRDPSAFGLDRCVFNPEKDIVDHQVVAFELDNGTCGTFTLAMQGPQRSERRIVLVGDDGTLDGTFEDGRFEVTFVDKSRSPFLWTGDKRSRGGHGGGDAVTLLAFLDACAGRAPPPISSADEAMRGLVFALAAEHARNNGTVVALQGDGFGAMY